MNRLRALIRTFFGFSRSETNAFIILLPLLIVIVFHEPVYEMYFTSGKPDYSEDRIALDSLVAQLKWKDTVLLNPVKVLATSFRFDPNKSTKDALVSLGIPEPVADRIMRYRDKGGKFKIKTDLRKMYGLPDSTFNRLDPYILLPDQLTSQKKDSSPITTYKKEQTVKFFDLNTADSVQLKSIYGIGPVLANRIIKYRDRLGGFVSYEQLSEVWGLDTAVVERLKKKAIIQVDFRPVQLKINSATEPELASHPYLKPGLARAIAAYRFQHGPFTSLSDLQKINLIDEKTFFRLKPYLTLE